MPSIFANKNPTAKTLLVGRPDNLSIGDEQDEFFDAQSDPQMEEAIEDMRKQVEESCLEVGLEPSLDNERNGEGMVSWSLTIFSFVIGSRLCLNCIEASSYGVFVSL